METVREQLGLFLYCVLLGGGAAFLLDMTRALRRSFLPGKFWVIFWDIAYWLLAAYFFIAYLYPVNGVSLRLYCFLAFLVGALIYFCMISRLFLLLAVPLLRFFKKILSFALAVLFFPVRLLLKGFRKTAVFCSRPLFRWARILKERWDMIRWRQKRRRKIKKRRLASRRRAKRRWKKSYGTLKK